MSIRNYTLDDHKCEEDPSPNLIEYYDNLFDTEEGARNAWASVTGTTSYDLESGYTYIRETGGDCELKGFYDTIAIYSMEYRQCPDFLVLFGATLGIDRRLRSGDYGNHRAVYIYPLRLGRETAEIRGPDGGHGRHRHQPAEQPAE